MYKVINRFKDNDGHVYEVGKPYPADGKKLVKSRAEFLTKVHPNYRVAFLEEVVEEPSTPPKKESVKNAIKKDESSDAK